MPYLQDEVNFDGINQKRDDAKIQKLKKIENQFGRKMEDWQFRLLPAFDEPIKVFCWYKDAILKDKKMYFDGNTASGNVAFNWVKEKHRPNLATILGDIEVILASNRKVLKSFFTITDEKFNKRAAKAMNSITNSVIKEIS